MKNNVSAQVNIDILATDQFEVSGRLFDHSDGSVKVIQAGEATSMQEANMKAIEVASGLVIAIGQIERDEAKSKLRLVN